MPTPSPSMSPTTLAICGTAIWPDRIPMALLPTTIAVSAATIGRLIATKEPNATNSTITAATMPISSLLGSASPLA
jgi:hypothetical protein